jgi:TRAP transporter TAXI family solute receptor
MKFVCYFIFTVSFLFSNASHSEESNQKIIKIGTGNKDALAYPIISSICDTFNRNNTYSSVSCQAISTEGSEDNLYGIISKKYDAGVIKADMEYNAYNGIGLFAGKPYRELRTILGLHNEYLTIIVKNGTNIKSLNDFKNRRVYIGNKGSGSRVMVDKLFAANGWKSKDFKEIYEEPSNKIYDLFCDNKIDAAIYLIGHPNSIFLKTLKECDTKLIGFSRQEIEKYVDIFRHISPAVIRKGTYLGQKHDLQTFASQLFLATSANMDEETVYNFVKVISEHHRDLQDKNPTLKGTDLFGPDIDIIPMHKGAFRNFFYPTH